MCQLQLSGVSYQLKYDKHLANRYLGGYWSHFLKIRLSLTCELIILWTTNCRNGLIAFSLSLWAYFILLYTALVASGCEVFYKSTNRHLPRFSHAQTSNLGANVRRNKGNRISSRLPHFQDAREASESTYHSPRTGDSQPGTGLRPLLSPTGTQEQRSCQARQKLQNFLLHACEATWENEEAQENTCLD